jgi:O-antigen ligase
MEPMSPDERVSPVETALAHRTGAGARRPDGGPPAQRVAAAAVAVAVVAAAVAVDPGGLRSFTSLRWLLVGGALAVAATALTRDGRPGPERAALPRWFIVPGLVVLVSMAIAALLVGDPATAWLGHPQRHLGVLAWFVFAAAAAAGAAMSASTAFARALGRATLVAASVTGLASTADLLGWSPLGTSFAGGRIGGLLGQPTTLGAFAVLLLPVVATAPVAPRVVRLVAAAGLLVTVLGTQTRGAVLGLVAAGLVALPALRPALRPSRALLAVAGVVVLLALPVGGRLLSSTDSGRVDEWRLAVEVIADHPVLGVGPEGYRIAVIGAFDERYVERHGRDVVLDRAHSAPLDVAASGGVAAGVAYVVLVSGVAISTWRLQRRAPWSLPAAAGTGALGFLVAGFVAFPTPEVDALAWLFAGIAVAAATHHRADPASPTRVPRRRAVARVGAGALVVVTLVAGVTDVIADRRLGTAAELQADGRVDDALASADRATGLRPDLVDGWYVAAQVAASGPTILDLDAGIDRAASGLARSPNDPALRQLHVELLAERAGRSELARDLVAALAEVDALLADDPTNPRALTLRTELTG